MLPMCNVLASSVSLELAFYHLIGSPVAVLTLIHRSFQFKAVEGNVLTPDTHFSAQRPNIGVESVPNYAEITGCIALSK